MATKRCTGFVYKHKLPVKKFQGSKPWIEPGKRFRSDSVSKFQSKQDDISFLHPSLEWAKAGKALPPPEFALRLGKRKIKPPKSKGSPRVLPAGSSLLFSKGEEWSDAVKFLREKNGFGWSELSSVSSEENELLRGALLPKTARETIFPIRKKEGRVAPKNRN